MLDTGIEVRGRAGWVHARPRQALLLPGESRDCSLTRSQGAQVQSQRCSSEAAGGSENERCSANRDQQEPLSPPAALSRPGRWVLRQRFMEQEFPAGGSP